MRSNHNNQGCHGRSQFCGSRLSGISDGYISNPMSLGQDPLRAGAGGSCGQREHVRACPLDADALIRQRKAPMPPKTDDCMPHFRRRRSVVVNENRIARSVQGLIIHSLDFKSDLVW